MRVLDKGLKFAPLKGLSKFQTYMDVHKYVRKLNIKRHFISNPIRDSNRLVSEYQHSGFSNAFLFNPPGTLAPSLRVLRNVVLRDLDNLKLKQAKSKKDLELGFESLCANKDRPIKVGGS